MWRMPNYTQSILSIYHKRAPLTGLKFKTGREQKCGTIYFGYICFILIYIYVLHNYCGMTPKDIRII